MPIMLMPIMLCSQWIFEESFAFTLMSNQSNVTTWILFYCEWTIEHLSAAHSYKDNSRKCKQCELRLSRMPSVSKHNRAYIFFCSAYYAYSRALDIIPSIDIVICVYSRFHVG